MVPSFSNLVYSTWVPWSSAITRSGGRIGVCEPLWRSAANWRACDVGFSFSTRCVEEGPDGVFRLLGIYVLRALCVMTYRDAGAFSIDDVKKPRFDLDFLP